MASKSKSARLAPQRDLKKTFMYWAVIVFLIKLEISSNIPAFNIEINGKPFLLDGIWLGADGENYLKGYDALSSNGVFSTESILSYWPAGYPLIILLLSLFSKGWVLTTLAIIQSLFFSFSAYFLASQLFKTRLKKYSHLVIIFILFNPTLSLSSLAVGYESLTASGLIIALAIVVKDFVEKNERKFVQYLIINSVIFGLLTFMQPRLLASGLMIILFWVVTKKGIKSAATMIVVSLAITLFFPATLIFRNNEATGLRAISTNLGNTMNLGAGDEATGSYSSKEKGVECKPTSSNPGVSDSQLVKCVLNWYLQNPLKSTKLFYNKTIYFWSPWYGPLADGTMARNPWLKVNPIKNITSTQDGINLVYGGFGKLISWLWLLGGVASLMYGFLILWRQKSLERFIGVFAMISIATNWVISLFSIGDHRFRIPIMGMSLLIQVIGLKTFLRGRKPIMVEGPSLR